MNEYDPRTRTPHDRTRLNHSATVNLSLSSAMARHHSGT